MKNKLYKIFSLSGLVLALTAISISAQVSSGGSYTLNQTVVAGGGGTSNDAVNNNYKIEGTGGQPSAGTQSMGGTYTTRGGFWSPNPFAPTAAGASISGNVIGIEGVGIRNVIVTLTGGTLIVPRTTRTNTFGNFTFEDIEVGQTYVIRVQSKKYGFPQDSQVFTLLDNISDISFQSTWEN